MQNVYTYGYVTEMEQKWLDYFSPFKHIYLTEDEDTDHLSATIAAIDKLKISTDRIIVMLQLTQPKRNSSLLWDACRKVYEYPESSVISYSLINIENRMLDENGSITESAAKEIKLYDGAIYAGTIYTFRDWFDMNTSHNTVKNNELSVVDIDEYEDLKKHLTWR